jgi:hypothetical protein
MDSTHRGPEKGDELGVADRRSAVTRLRNLFKDSTPPGADLVDELIQERREDARREDEWMEA